MYTDDILVISENAESILRKDPGRYFELKESSTGPPNIYLGGQVRKVELDNGTKAWDFSSSQYVQPAVTSVDSYLTKQDNWKMPKKAETPMTTSYCPEMDITPVLSPCDASYYISLIEIIRWMVKLGQVDICPEVSMMSSHMAMPREGNLNELFHIFIDLQKYHNTEMIFDPSDPIIDESKHQKRNWTPTEFGHLQDK